MSFTETLQGLTGKPLANCTNQELYLALLELVRQKSADRVQPVTGRKLYYISAEFLIGKLLSNNLINLGLYDEARDALAAGVKAVDLFVDNAAVFASKGEMRKLVQGGGVSLNKEKLAAFDQVVTTADLLDEKYLLVQRGKKNYYLIIAK